MKIILLALALSLTTPVLADHWIIDDPFSLKYHFEEDYSSLIINNTSTKIITITNISFANQSIFLDSSGFAKTLKPNASMYIYSDISQIADNGRAYYLRPAFISCIHLRPYKTNAIIDYMTGTRKHTFKSRPLIGICDV